MAARGSGTGRLERSNVLNIRLEVREVSSGHRAGKTTLLGMDCTENALGGRWVYQERTACAQAEHSLRTVRANLM